MVYVDACGCMLMYVDVCRMHPPPHSHPRQQAACAACTHEQRRQWLQQRYADKARRSICVQATKQQLKARLDMLRRARACDEKCIMSQTQAAVAALEEQQHRDGVRNAWSADDDDMGGYMPRSISGAATMVASRGTTTSEHAVGDDDEDGVVSNKDGNVQEGNRGAEGSNEGQPHGVVGVVLPALPTATCRLALALVRHELVCDGLCAHLGIITPTHQHHTGNRTELPFPTAAPQPACARTKKSTVAVINIAQHCTTRFFTIN